MESVRAFAIVAGICLAVAGLLAPIYLIGRWILGPIDRAARHRELPVRFSIGDFLCLFLAIQIPLACIYQFVEAEEKRLFWLFTVLTWMIGPVIWYACARSLSKAGVTNGRHRFIFIGLVMPVVYYGLVPFVLLSFVGAMSLAGTFLNRTIGDPQEILMRYRWMMVTWAVLAYLFLISGLYTHWMIRQAAANANELATEAQELDSVQTGTGDA